MSEKKIKPKFNVGDNVWFIKNAEAITEMIMAVYVLGNKVFYSFDTYNIFCRECSNSIKLDEGIFEEKVFATKEELLKSL